MEKYSSIIMNRNDRSEFLLNLEILSYAFKDKKLLEVIKAVDIKSDVKIRFLLSLLQNTKQEFINFLKVLILNNKLELIPLIYDNLVKKIALEDNICYGVIYSKESILDDDIRIYENKLSERFSKNIKLKNIISNNDEIRVYIEDLGYEITVSNTSLREKLKQHIIKVI
ncbi:F0F1 ATP synthase subunit delta [Campylobacter sp. MG1]|uniref:F0F1 ATP synthase subunit delta n=1 Tax=Campylobacter sp. MG1 TaxID=2976332 RepID=UPI00226D2997|nr:F0F1 ATP synthase subunit delta [Campylobacter sp. MG1]